MQTQAKVAAENKEPQIFKIQRPLYTTEGNYQLVLIYNEDRTIQCQLKLGIEQIMLIFGDPEDEEACYKVYVMATVTSSGMLDIKEVLHPDEEPHW